MCADPEPVSARRGSSLAVATAALIHVEERSRPGDVVVRARVDASDDGPRASALRAGLWLARRQTGFGAKGGKEMARFPTSSSLCLARECFNVGCQVHIAGPRPGVCQSQRERVRGCGSRPVILRRRGRWIRSSCLLRGSPLGGRRASLRVASPHLQDDEEQKKVLCLGHGPMVSQRLSVRGESLRTVIRNRGETVRASATLTTRRGSAGTVCSHKTLCNQIARPSASCLRGPCERRTRG